MKKRTSLLPLTMTVLALTALPCRSQSTYEPYAFTTLAGRSPFSNPDGTGSGARFHNPQGVVVDSAGNLYVTDTEMENENITIRKVTPAGVVTTMTGLVGSVGAVDAAGNLYLTFGNSIQKATLAGTHWVVTTLAGLADNQGSADGTGSDARFHFYYLSGVAVDIAGSVYVVDSFNFTVRKVTPSGVVTTLAGRAGSRGTVDGSGSDARFSGPSGVAVDTAGNVVVADGTTIRKVTPAGAVTTLAGMAGSAGTADGTGSDARFRFPSSVAVDTASNIYVTDTESSTIRKVTPVGVVTTLAGLARLGADGFPMGGYADGAGSTARFVRPSGVAVDGTGNVYVADTGNDTIRKMTPTGVVTTFAGLADRISSVDGTGITAQFGSPSGVAVDGGRNVYVTDANCIRKVTPAGAVTTLAGVAGSSGSADGTGSDARFSRPQGVAVDSLDNLYVADSDNFTIRKVTPAGVVTTLAGLAGSEGSADGTGSDARFGRHPVENGGPKDVAVDRVGNVYVADSGNSTIRKVTPTGAVTTLAGLAGSYGSADGTGSAARFHWPSGVAVDSAANVYVTDGGSIWTSYNWAIRKVTSAGVVTTLAGLAEAGSADGVGSDARFHYPWGVAVDGAGNVYVADYYNHTIRKVAPTGVVTTLAGLSHVVIDGLPVSGYADGTGSDARFGYPRGVAVDSDGNVYVADTNNHTIRKGYAAPRILNSEPNIGFSGGQFGFNLTGPSGQSVVLEASTDLLHWLPLWTNTLTFPAALNFRDPQSGVSSPRFYRARLP